jgi:hypothetical protein
VLRKRDSFVFSQKIRESDGRGVVDGDRRRQQTVYMQKGATKGEQTLSEKIPGRSKE